MNQINKRELKIINSGYMNAAYELASGHRCGSWFRGLV